MVRRMSPDDFNPEIRRRSRDEVPLTCPAIDMLYNETMRELARMTDNGFAVDHLAQALHDMRELARANATALRVAHMKSLQQLDVLEAQVEAQTRLIESLQYDLERLSTTLVGQMPQRRNRRSPMSPNEGGPGGA